MSKDLLSIFQALDDSSFSREQIIKSPLNYMGSKRDSLERILELLPIGDVWVDVFGGSGAVTLGRKPSKLDVFNDRHSGISAFFISIQSNPDLLIEHIKHLPHSREVFDWCRANVEKATHDTMLRGVMWYYLVQSSFAGRAKYFGRVVKPVSPVYNKIYNNLELFGPVSERFRKVQVENADWRMLFKDYDSPNTVWYLDPPYYDSNVYEYSMSKEEHLEMCSKIFNLEGFVALSGYDNPVYDQFEWDAVHEFELTNNVVSAAHTAGSVMEGKEHLSDRGTKRVEKLWIKEAY